VLRGGGNVDDDDDDNNVLAGLFLLLLVPFLCSSTAPSPPHAVCCLCRARFYVRFSTYSLVQFRFDLRVGVRNCWGRGGSALVAVVAATPLPPPSRLRSFHAFASATPAQQPQASIAAGVLACPSSPASVANCNRFARYPHVAISSAVSLRVYAARTRLSAQGCRIPLPAPAQAVQSLRSSALAFHESSCLLQVN